jgi:hypothetical protein
MNTVRYWIILTNPKINLKFPLAITGQIHSI